jgi:hypothetical protein
MLRKEKNFIRRARTFVGNQKTGNAMFKGIREHLWRSLK